MATLVAFSGESGDSIWVEEDVNRVLDGLDTQDVAGLCRLTQVPSPSPLMQFEPTAVFVNPSRVAFLREEIRTRA